LPGLTGIAGNNYTRGRGPDPDYVRSQRRDMDSEDIIVDTGTERDLFPTFVKVITTIKSLVGTGIDAVLTVFGKSKNLDLAGYSRHKLASRRNVSRRC
jgi:hypothetical protein